MPDRISLYDLLQEPLKSDPNVAAAAKAVDQEMAKYENMIPRIHAWTDIDNQPEQVVDLLAWTLHCDFYEPLTMELTKKIALVRQAPEMHLRKGTPYAVQELVTAAFSEAWTTEWFDYGGRPYYFKVTTTDPVVDELAIQYLVAAINTMKNTRSWLELIEVLRQLQQNIYYGSGIFQQVRTTIQPYYGSTAADKTTWFYSGILFFHLPRITIKGE